MRIIFLLFCFCIGASLEAKQLKVDISARSALLINAETGAILYQKDPHLPCHPASTLKIATALYALEKKQQDLAVPIAATQDAVGVVLPKVKFSPNSKHPDYRLTTDGTHMSLRAGEILTLETLFYGLMLSSGNDAANVIAEYVSGAIPQFMEELNRYLQQIGCQETRFFNPSGLPHPKQFTTACDLARMAQEAMKFPFFRQVVKTVQFPRPQTNKQPPSTLVQHNRLLKRGPLFYPRCIGIKTGFTDAGYNFVGAAKEGNRTLIAVVLYNKEGAQCFKDAIALFEAAFGEAKTERTLLTKEYDRYTLPLKGAETSLEALLGEDLKVAYFPAEEPELKAFLQWDSLQLPISKGARVGEVQLKTAQGQIFKTAPLFAAKDLEATTLVKFLEAIALIKVYIGQIVILSLIIGGLIFMWLRNSVRTRR